MVKDPYETLGVKRDATPDQIRRAFRNLAKRHHPDVNPGNREAEERFKTIGVAHELLSDPEKRARFDRGEIDAAGQERPEHAFARANGGRPGEPDLSEIFGELFRRGGGARPDSMPTRGGDQRYQLEVSFADAVGGALRRLTLPDGRSLEVTIPPGTETGHVLRLRGQGGAGWNGAAAGDALIEIVVAPHRHFRREGDDLHLDLPVTVAEAVLGAKIEVPTPSGSVTMTVPRHSDSGRQLRLRGRGVPAHAGRPAGDLYVRLSLVIGPVDDELEAALRDWSARHDAAPRAAVEL